MKKIIICNFVVLLSAAAGNLRADELDTTGSIFSWPIRQLSYSMWSPTPEPDPLPGPADDVEEVIRLPQLEQEVDHVEEFVEVPKIWSWSVEMGLNGTESEKDMFNMHLGVDVKRKTACSTATFKLTHINSSSDGERTARNLIYDTRLEWPCATTCWTYFIHHGGEYDEFKPFDIRLNFDGGVGYRFFDDGDSHFIGRFGGSASRQINGLDNTTVPELVFGLDVAQEINCMHSLEAEIEYYPDVTNWNEWRMNTSASWAIRISQARNINVKFSIIERFDTHDPVENELTLDYAVLLMWKH